MEELTTNPEIDFGSLYTDLQALVFLITKAVDYYEAKVDILDPSL